MRHHSRTDLCGGRPERPFLPRALPGRHRNVFGHNQVLKCPLSCIRRLQKRACGLPYWRLKKPATEAWPYHQPRAAASTATRVSSTPNSIDTGIAMVNAMNIGENIGFSGRCS